MQRFSAIGMFCEDIREEKNGQDILVGILPDSLTIAQTPSFIPKLGLYIRVHVRVDAPCHSLHSRLVNTDGTHIDFPPFDPSEIEKSFQGSLETGMTFTGLIMKAIMGPFPVPKVGIIRAYLSIDDEEFEAAALNILEDKSLLATQVPWPKPSS